jgi:hypothetical protein
MRKRGLLAILALTVIVAFAFLFSGAVSASEMDSPAMLFNESGNFIGTKVDPAIARREMTPDMLQSYGEPIAPVHTGQENLKVFSIEDDPIPMEPPFAPDVLVYTSGTADDTPRIAFNPTDGWLWTAFTHFNGADDDMYVMYSDDLGVTWNPALNTIGAFNERNPSIAIAGNTITIAYEQDAAGEEQNTYFLRSQDGGQNWGGFYMPWDWTNPDVQLTDFKDPDLSVSRPGWFHWTMSAWGAVDSTRTVAFMWTEDDGDSWWRVYWTLTWHMNVDFERPVIMENTADEYMHNAYMRQNNSVGGYDIEWLIVDHPLSDVFGWWTPYLDDDNTEIQPDIAVKDDTVYLIWQNDTVDPDLNGFYSDDGGVNVWYLQITALDGYDQMYPSVYLDENFEPHISYVNDTRIGYINGTGMWTADDFPGATVADFRATEIIYALNNPRIVFADARLGAADIWYTDLGAAPEIPITITHSPLIAEGFILVNGTEQCWGTCVYNWILGSTHTLEAPGLMGDIPDPDNVRYAFASWSDGGLQSHIYTVPSASETITAYYDPQYNITVDTLPVQGLEVVVDAMPYAGGVNFWWTLGEVHNIDVTTPQTIDGTSRYAWQSWSDGGGQSHPVTITQVETYIATFGIEYMVNVTTIPPNLQVEVDAAVLVSPQSFWWLDGSVHDLNAISPQPVTPDERWSFVDWSDAGAQAHQITVTGPATYTANYIMQYNISFTTSPLNLEVEVDTVVYPTTGPVYFFWDVGSMHNIGAPSPQPINPTSQYVWLSWNDMGLQYHDITVIGPATFTASFGVEFRIDVNTNPIGLNVTVDAVEYPAPYSFWCAQGSSAMLGAPSPQPQTPTMRYSWQSWSDMGTQSHPIICNMANTYTANFIAQYLLNVSSDPQGLLVEVEGIQWTAPRLAWYDTGTVVTINAPSPQLSGNTQAVYSHWNDGQPQTHQITVTGPATYIAYYDTQFLMTVTSTPVTGLDIEVNGIPQVTEYQFWCNDGSLHNTNAVSPQAGPVANSRYVWNSWSDGLGQSHTVTCDAPNTYTADFGLEYQVTVTTNPAGRQVEIDGLPSGSPYTAWWADGSVHNIGVPSPQDLVAGSSQYVFTSWSDAGAQYHDITVIGADTYVASFTLQYKITITTNPVGLEIIADGVPQPTPYIVWLDSGASYGLDVTDPQVVGAGERYSFNSWSDSQPKSHTIIVAMAQTYTADMDHEFEVTIDSLPAGGISITVDGTGYTTPRSFWWLEGSIHSISGIDFQDIGAGVRYAFASWSDLGQRTHNVDADMAKTLTATYTTQYEVTIATNPTGLEIVVDLQTYTSPQAFWWDDGSTYDIDVVTPQPGATADERYAFASWSDAGAQSHQVTATQSETITASFDLEYEVVITSTPAGRDITVDSTPYVTPQTFWAASGGTLDVQGTSPQAGATGTRYLFSQWSDGPVTFDRTITVTAATTYTVVFVTEFEVTITTSPAGMEIIVDLTTLTAPQSFWWSDGSSHDVDVVTPQPGASADERYAYASWTDGGAQSHSVTVDQSETITANFDLEYEVIITSTPVGREITVNFVTYTTPQTFWSSGTLAVSGLSPQPLLALDTRYTFAGWSDGPTAFSRTITVTTAATYTATFTTEHSLMVISLFGAPQGTGWYEEGTVADFSVTSPVTVEGHEMKFTEWSGDSTATTATATVTMDGPKTVTAGWKEVEEPGFLAEFWWIILLIVIIIIAVVVLLMLKRKKPGEEELPPPEEMEIPPEEEV